MEGVGVKGIKTNQLAHLWKQPWWAKRSLSNLPCFLHSLVFKQTENTGAKRTVSKSGRGGAANELQDRGLQ